MDASDFLIIFPQFSAEHPKRIQFALDQAAREMDITVWNNLFDDGHGYLAAHKLSKLKAAEFLTSRNAAGSIKKISGPEEGIEMSIAVNNANSFSTTPYGELYQDLLRKIGPVGITGSYDHIHNYGYV